MSPQDVQEIAASKSIEFVAFTGGGEIVPGAISEFKNLRTLKAIHLDHANASVVRELAQVSSLEQIELGCDTRQEALDNLAELKKLPKLWSVIACGTNEAKYPAIRARLPGVKVTLYPDRR